MITRLDKLKKIRKALRDLGITMEQASDLLEEYKNIDFEYEDEKDRLEYLSESYKDSLKSNLQDQAFVLGLKKAVLILTMTIGLGLGTLTFDQNNKESDYKLKCEIFVIFEMLATVCYQKCISNLYDLSLDETDYRYKVKKIQYDREKLEKEHKIMS